MNILMLNTSTPICTLSLATKLGVATLQSDAVYQHGEKVLEFIETLLKEQSLHLSNVDVIGLINGPGSFVGTRLGGAVAQALAFVHEIPIALVSTLQAIAQTVYQQQRIARVTVIQDARMKQVYLASFLLGPNHIMTCDKTDYLFSLSSQSDFMIESDCIVGDGVSLWQAQRGEFNGIVIEKPDIEVEAVMNLVQTKIQSGETVSAAEMKMCY